MTTELIRGQKAKLTDLTPALQLDVGLKVTAPAGQSVDISCFGLDTDGKLSDDRYFIFYNQKASPCGSLTAQGASGGDNEVFRVDLGKLPQTIRRLVFVATLDGSANMSGLGQSHLRISAQGQDVARFGFDGSAFGAEKAVMVAEVYYKDQWRVSAVGQGFAGGLSAVLKHFGGSEIAAPAPAAPAAPPPAAAAAPAPAAKPAEPSKVNLGKVTLDKRGSKQAVNLKKGGAVHKIHVNLNWDAPKKGILGGLFSAPAPDLDLGCMIRMADGYTDVIQPLGGNFGSRNGMPYVYLDKDDRSGASSDGENLYILRPDLIDKIMVFALIYEGAAKFTDVNARLTIKEEGGQEILIRLDNADPNLRLCSICTIDRRGDRVEITKEERYFASHRFADEHFGFGFNWVAGRK